MSAYFCNTPFINQQKKNASRYFIGRRSSFLPRMLFSQRVQNVYARTVSGDSYFAFLAISQRAVNAAGSWMAVSDSILRFMSTPASFRPCMNFE